MKRELVTGLLTLSLLASMLPANAQAVSYTHLDVYKRQAITTCGW